MIDLLIFIIAFPLHVNTFYYCILKRYFLSHTVVYVRHNTTTYDYCLTCPMHNVYIKMELILGEK